MAKSTAVLSPNLGLYLDANPLSLPARGLKDGLNFRVLQGRLTNQDIGWTRKGTFVLDGAVRLIDVFTKRDQADRLIYLTPTSIYLDNYDGTVSFLNPRYETGTASASGTSVSGAGGAAWVTGAVAAGDFISFGATGVVDPDAVWYEVLSVGGETGIVLTASAGTVGAGPYTIRYSFHGEHTAHWDTAVFLDADPEDDDLWFATNGIDPIMKWDGLTDQVENAGFDFTCRHLAVFQNMLILANITQGGEELPTTIINSNVGQPSNVSSGLSEQFVVHSRTIPIIDLKPFGDNLVIYSGDGYDGNVVLTQFIGDPEIFAFRHVVSGSGPISPLAVADFGDVHEFLGIDSLYRFDGTQAQNISEHVWRSVLHNHDQGRLHHLYQGFDLNHGELIWAIPQDDDPDDEAPAFAWVEHYLEDVGQLPRPYSKREFPFSALGRYAAQSPDSWDASTHIWDFDEGIWDNPTSFTANEIVIAGASDGKVYTLNTGPNADGVAMNCFVRTGRFATADGRMRALIARVSPFVNNQDSIPSDFLVTLHLTDYADGNTTASETLAYPLPPLEDYYFVTPYRRARYVEYEFGSNSIGATWEFTGYDRVIRLGGNR